MKAALVAVLGVFVCSACGGSSSSPAPGPTETGFIVSGTVYGIDATGRRPLEGAMVEIADSATSAWGQYGRPMTNTAGRYVFPSVPKGHYAARASKAGYSSSVIVNLGYLEAARTLDFELTSSGSTAGFSLAAISPNTGSTGGGTRPVRISGTGFQSGATVRFGDLQATAYLENSTTLQATTPIRGAGTVDVVVTNAGGQTATLVGAYTFASPQSFDFNGTWVGYALAHPELLSRWIPLHSDMDLRFTVQSNVLTGVTCGGAAISTLAPAPPVNNGEFSFAGEGVTITGRIVSPVSAIGTINTGPCPSTRWTVTRQ